MNNSEDGVLPKKPFLLVELNNYDQLKCVYGSWFSDSAMKNLHFCAHAFEGSIHILHHNVFLIELPPTLLTRNDFLLSVIEVWQLRLSNVSVESKDVKVLLSVSVRGVISDGVGAENKSLIDYSDGFFKWQSANLATVTPFWSDHLKYELDMEIVVAFYEALKNGEAYLLLNRVASCNDRSNILYEEALIRVGYSANFSTFSPDRLVPALERLGLVRLLDYTVITSVIDYLSIHPLSRIACNVSAQSLVCDGWWSSIIKKLSESNSLASRLTFEITETANIEDMEGVISFVSTLQQLGCRVALDDFGSGRMPFSILFSIRPDIIKISGQILHLARCDSKKKKQLNCLVALCSTVSPDVVVEGIENLSDLSAIIKSKAKWGQGFYFENKQAEILPKYVPISYKLLLPLSF